MYEIRYRKQAAKKLTRMPKHEARRFLAAFEQLAQNPEGAELDIKPLAGRAGFRLRIGQWRALYRVEDHRLYIEVIRIGARGDVYK